MKARAKEYLTWLAGQSCIACGCHGVELAHLRGPISRKTGLTMPRRKGEAHFYCLPICPSCHRTGSSAVHSVGERKFFDRLGKDPHQLVATHFCRFFEGTP